MPPVVIIIIIIIPGQCLWCWHHDSRVVARVHLVHAMNAEPRQTAADLWTKPMYLSHMPTCRLLGNHILRHHLLLLSPKADTCFTIPQRVGGWVELVGSLHLMHTDLQKRARCHICWSWNPVHPYYILYAGWCGLCLPAVRRQEVIRLTEQITAATMTGDYDTFSYVVQYSRMNKNKCETFSSRLCMTWQPHHFARRLFWLATCPRDWLTKQIGIHFQGTSSELW